MSDQSTVSVEERTWDQDDFDDDQFDDDELDDFYDCHGFFESQSPRAVFVCGAVGSEDCDECPMHAWLGLTNRQIDRLEETDE